tara:strand:- start:1419 stop:2657 length:1239 start_codon:yes stop_codon:yes gene_type:complete
LSSTQAYIQTITESNPVDIATLVNHVIQDSIDANSSDIHIEPWEDTVGVRIRTSGVLKLLCYIPLEFHPMICGRVKVMASMASHRHDVPQDGKAAPPEFDGVQLRVSIFPTVKGEKIVMRIFNPQARTFDINSLGFDEETLDKFVTVLNKPTGLILLTGPTGSGKTTAIYAAIGHLLEKHQNAVAIASVEDPVEQNLMWVNQSQLNIAQDYTYVAALRSLMRQDPEVIMIGEIRDVETATIAVTAGMTGHLVISTIHSGTTAGVFARLINMDIEPFLLASSIIGIMGVRLVRLNCQYCTNAYTPEDYALHHLRTHESDEFVDESLAAHTFKCGWGCDHCGQTGFDGRGAVTELMSVDEAVRETVMNKRPTREIQQAAMDNGMQTLWDGGLRRVTAGETTIEEMLMKVAAEML